MRGYVTASDDGESLIGATVYSGTRGAVAGEHGSYVIRLPEGNVTLNCSCLGYEKEESVFTLQRDTIINFVLSPGYLLEEARVSAISDSDIRSSLSGVSSLSSANIINTLSPFGEPDLLRSVLVIPGVQSGMSGSSSLYVRGGGPDENLFLLDGVPMYNVAHLLGVFSAFPPDIIKKADFYKSSFPARFGGRTSSVLDIYSKDGNNRRLSGTLSLGLLNSRIHLDGPLVKGKTTFSLSVRSLHTTFARPFMNLDDYQTWFSFYDVHSRVSHRFSDSDWISASFYSGKDSFSYVGDETLTHKNDEDFRSHETIRINWGNTMGALKWTHIFPRGWHANLSIGTCYYSMFSKYNTVDIDRALKEYIASSTIESSLKDWQISVGTVGYLTPTHSLYGGLSATIHYCDPRLSGSYSESGESLPPENDFQSFKGQEFCIYVEDEMKLSGGFSARVGLRMGYMKAVHSGFLSPEPRLSLRQALGRDWAVKLSYARLSQFVHLLSSSYVSLPTDMWVPSTDDIPPLYADQISLGSYYEGLPGWEFSADVYFKSLDNLLEYRDGALFSSASPLWEDMVDIGIGRSYGLELQVKKVSGRCTGSASYVFSDAWRRFPSGNVNNGNWFHSKYVRQNSFRLVASYDFSNTTRLNLSWSIASGTRMSLPMGYVYMPSSEVDGVPVLLKYIPSRNNYVLPPSQSLDVGLIMDFYHKTGKSTLNVGVTNLYNARNPDLVYLVSRRSGSDIQEWSQRTITYLPILPSINYSYSF